MSHKAKIELCPLCDSKSTEVLHDQSIKYRYLKKVHVLDGQEHTVCKDCGCSFFGKGQIERNNVRFLEFEKSIVKDISPRNVLELREKYQLSQEQATRIFNCGATAFSKWERGEVAPTGTAALMLQLALEDSYVMKILAEKAGERVSIPDVMGVRTIQSTPMATNIRVRKGKVVEDYSRFLEGDLTPNIQMRRKTSLSSEICFGFDSTNCGD